MNTRSRSGVLTLCADASAGGGLLLAGVLIVTGSPEARQGTTFMSGTKVRLALGNERLEVENAKIIVETAPVTQKKKPGAAPAGGARKP